MAIGSHIPGGAWPLSSAAALLLVAWKYHTGTLLKYGGIAMSNNMPGAADGEESRPSRRGLITGGAMLLGGAVLGAQGTADAANGGPWLLGRSNTESATTKVTMSGNAAALSVTNTNAGTSGHAILGSSSAGWGLLGESTHSHGGVARTNSGNGWGLVAQNRGTPGSGGGVSAVGASNTGLQATTTNPDKPAIRAQQLATTSGGAGAIQADGGFSVGVRATSRTTAVMGTSTSNYGVLGSTSNTNAAGIWGRNVAAAGGGSGILAEGVNNIGLQATTDSTSKAAVYAQNTGSGKYAGGSAVRADGGNENYGVLATSVNTQAIHAESTNSIAIFTGSTNRGTALFVNGDAHVNGTLSKSAGSFKIDHPIDPANKYLYHSFVESPDMMNVYNGVAVADANGSATVNLPDWFESLNRDFRYQLTPLGSEAPRLHVSAEVAASRFTIAGATPGQRISWQVTGIRKDSWANDHRIPVEEAKPADERGSYLYPEGFGKTASAGLMA